MATFVAHAQYEYIVYSSIANSDFHDLIVAALASQQVGTVT